jgi:hypothetical protein
MSADSWAMCPRCTNNDEQEIPAMERKLHESYGKVSFEEYEQMQTTIDECRYERDNNPRRATFREDYEFYGAETGTLQISYSGQCTVCGLKLKFQEERDFYVPKAP